MKNVNIVFEGKESRVTAEIVDRQIWFKFEDEIMSMNLVDLQDSYSNKATGSKSSSDRIVAPMPGKITKVFKKQNDIVDKGEALLVMEAMKMEYTLKSDINSQVVSIGVQVGDQVALGQLLVQLKKG